MHVPPSAGKRNIQATFYLIASQKKNESSIIHNLTYNFNFLYNKKFRGFRETCLVKFV
ncbi:protein of unknown function [Tenacibaculum sp. 190524A02b]